MVDTADGFSASVEPLSGNILSEDKTKNHVHDTSIVKVYERSILTSAGLSLGGQRLLRVVLSLITPQDKASKRYSFYIDDYKNVFNMSEYPIQQLKLAAAELLVPRDFNMSGKADEFNMSGLITQMSVKGGVATFSIADDLLPIYQSLKGNNDYLLGYTKEFSCSYSFSFYELFLEILGNNTENSNSAVVYYSLEKLQEWLKLGNKYIDPRTKRLAYAGFKRKVLVPVLNDINRATEEGTYCNINCEMTEHKAGRRVIGVEFSIWRTSSIIKEQPMVNKFYSKLSPDVKLAYDNLIALDIKQSEIENCIIRNKEKGFLNIYYFITKQKYQGAAYISSILRNDVTEFDSQRMINIKSLQRAYTISDAEQKRYEETEDIIRKFSKEDKVLVNTVVKRFLLEHEPYIYKHLSTMSFDEILDTKDLKMFYLEMYSHILLNKLDKEILTIYQKQLGGEEKKGILATTSSKVTDIFKEYGINKNVWPSLIEYPEDYILANVQYCVDRYKKGKGQKDIAGAIVKAIQLDYAGFKTSKKESELEKMKKDFQNNTDAAMRNLFSPQMDESSTVEDVPAIEEDVPPKESHSSVRDSSSESVIDEAYESFIENSNINEKELLKTKTIEQMSDFQKTVICGLLKNYKRVKPEELIDVPIDVLLKVGLFEKTYKKVFVEELDL